MASNSSASSTTGPSSKDFEKLGVFYLGAEYDLAAKKRQSAPLLYDSKDLVTHAVCVGMTGSGKTGLCLGILEEAAIDGIPAIIIDPKGDLSNLLLTFPELRPADFRPWINEEDARKKGMSPDDFAAAQAALWTKGLGDWGQDGARIQKFKDAADVLVYTPGSSAGLPVSVLKSFDCPPPEILEDGELCRERVGNMATSLLGLMGISVEPMQSREHILLSAIINDAWGKGRNVDLAMLIERIQQPPFDKLGVMSLESVYPSKDRFQLAMNLNNLIAAPGFQAWMTGEPLDIGAILHTSAGKPRHAIFSIAHLSDSERMFFVSLLLNQVLSWVRTQSGTTSLRALVYMDEIAGYFPPTANPPSKQPLLTLMKQSRAFGVGIMLATQNPVDLDYKGLANAGTWFIGRLQTDRDKQRVLDGLEGAAGSAGAGFDRAGMDKMLSQLGQRVFLMNNVHDDRPAIFETRWCLSYLRGPLTRQQIKMVMDPLRTSGTSAKSAGGSGGSSSQSAARSGGRSGVAAESAGVGSAVGVAARPVLPAEIQQYAIPARAIPAGSLLQYRPMLLGLAQVYYSDPKAGIDQDMKQSLLAPFTTGPVAVDWDKAQQVELGAEDLEREPAAGATFAALPAEAGKAKSYATWTKDCADTLFKIGKLELMSFAPLKLKSKQDENEKEFRVRVGQALREQRDLAKEKLRQKYAPKLTAMQERMRRAEAAVEAQKSQSTGAKVSAALSVGAAILGAFLGRKAVSTSTISRGATAMRGAQRAFQESGDVARAEETVEAVQAQLAALEQEFKDEADKLDASADASTATIETVTLKPKKTNIKVKAVVLAWAPFSVGNGDSEADATPAW